MRSLDSRKKYLSKEDPRVLLDLYGVNQAMEASSQSALDSPEIKDMNFGEIESRLSVDMLGLNTNT